MWKLLGNSSVPSIKQALVLRIMPINGLMYPEIGSISRIFSPEKKIPEVQNPIITMIFQIWIISSKTGLINDKKIETAKLRKNQFSNIIGNRIIFEGNPTPSATAIKINTIKLNK